jgi:hypothetical protein
MSSTEAGAELAALRAEESDLVEDSDLQQNTPILNLNLNF